jgi:hypothetical protein
MGLRPHTALRAMGLRPHTALRARCAREGVFFLGTHAPFTTMSHLHH